MLEKETLNYYPEIKPLSGKASKLLVLLHGLGSDGHDLIELVPYLQSSLQDYHFISPHGVEPYDMAPMGRQWFSLGNRNEEVIMNLVRANYLKLQKIIEDKQTELGLTNADTVLAGFSQGAMIASYLTLVQEIPYAAMIGFSGRVLSPESPKNIKTPICIIHGKQDEVVPPIYAEEFALYCRENNISCEMLLINNLTHSIDASGIESALKFLHNIK